MHEINHVEAFASYKAKPVHRGRSAVTSEGALVLSCRYAGFKKVEGAILRYEEDLSSETGEAADALRAHVSEALTGEYAVHLIVAVEAAGGSTPAEVQAGKPPRPGRTTYHARKDLVGQVTAFDGQHLVVEFRRVEGFVPPAKSSSKAGARRSFI